MPDFPDDPLRLRAWALWVIAAHTVVVAIHALAHSDLGIVSNQAADNVFIVVVYYVGPIAAAWGISRRRKAGAPLLFGTMTAGCAYGLLFHFVISGPDQALHAGTAGPWGLVFLVTSVALAVLEGTGALQGWLLMQGRGGPDSSEPASPTL